MNLFRCMQAFILTVKTGSFAAASVSLNTSPQMIAKYIAFLENYLGLKLLNRTTRSQNLTEFGKQYYPKCLSILAEIQATKVLAQQFSEEPKGNLRISAPVSYGYYNLIPVISDFMKRYPKVEVDIQLSDRYVDLVQDNFDIVFRIGQLADSGLIARKLKPYQLTFAASPSYLSQHGVPSVPKDLEKHNCLIYQYMNLQFNSEIDAVRILADAWQSNDIQNVTLELVYGHGVKKQVLPDNTAPVQFYSSSTT